MDKIYLDHNATCPLPDEVQAAVIQALPLFGNPSSIHWAGREPKRILRESRQEIANYFGVSQLELIFTSGASESNNAAVFGVLDAAQKAKNPRNEFITLRIEHPSVVNSFKQLESLGYKVHWIDVDSQGRLDWQAFANALSDKTLLTSMMVANNETGLILPIERVFSLAKEAGSLTHTDATQALGKMNFKLNTHLIDLASFSGHKFYGLKGSGLLFVKQRTPWNDWVHGGAQERGRRGGTENVLGVAAMAAGLKFIKKFGDAPWMNLSDKRNYFENQVLQKISGLRVTHENCERLANTTSLMLEGIDGETLLMSLDLEGFAVSTGAACSSGSPEPSPTLLALGFSKAEAQNSLRVSVGLQTTLQEIDLFVETLSAVVARLRTLQHQALNEVCL